MQIDTAIIWASLIADSQISGRLADVVVAFVSFLRMWKHCGCLTMHAPWSQHETLHCSGLCLLVLIGRNKSPVFLCACQQNQGMATDHVFTLFMLQFFTCANILRCSLFRWIVYNFGSEFLKQCWGLCCMFQPRVWEQIGVGDGKGALCIIQWSDREIRKPQRRT